MIFLQTPKRIGKTSASAGVAELVDALGLGPSAFGVGVRVPSPVPPKLTGTCPNVAFSDGLTLPELPEGVVWLQDVAVRTDLP